MGKAIELLRQARANCSDTVLGATVASNLGAAYTVQGHLPRAGQAFAESAKGWGRYVSPDAVEMGILQNNMGVLYAKGAMQRWAAGEGTEQERVKHLAKIERCFRQVPYMYHDNQIYLLQKSERMARAKGRATYFSSLLAPFLSGSHDPAGPGPHCRGHDQSIDPSVAP